MVNAKCKNRNAAASWNRRRFFRNLLLIAAGFVGCRKEVADAFGLPRDNRGSLITTDYHTPSDKVFAAGDCRRGQSLVVWAITEGRACAKQVDAYLMGYSNML